MEVCWSPQHKNKFYTLGTNLNLYEVYHSERYSQDDVQEIDMRLSNETKASLICTKNNAQYRYVTWRPHPEPDHLLAIGFNTGKVLLSSLTKSTTSDTFSLSGSEFILKHHRACNFLEWNAEDPILLSEVTEKLKTDGCIVVWDVHHSSNHTDTSHTLQQASHFTKPYLEIGVNESCSSFAWLHSRSFICGMNFKYLRIYDIRSPTEPLKAQESTPTKGINLIKVNPLFPNHVASVYENHLYIWDTRRLSEAYDTIVEKTNFSRVAWCPTQKDLLACSFVDSPDLKLYDITKSNSSMDKKNNFRIDRQLKPIRSLNDEDHISSFSWHPSDLRRMLLASTSGNIHDHTIHDRFTMDWSADSTLACALGEEVYIATVDGVVPDLSTNIRKRALKQYGIQQKLADNLTCVQDDKDLLKIWTWISSIKPEHDSPSPPSQQPYDHLLNQSSLKNSSYAYSLDSAFSPGLTQSPTSPSLPTIASQSLQNNAVPTRLAGVVSILQGSLRGSTQVELDWIKGLPVKSGIKDVPRKVVYHSNERMLVLELCGWKSTETTIHIVDRLEREGQVCRAAALSVFNVRLTKALEVLKRGGKSHMRNDQTDGTDLNMVAMTLAGFLSDHGGMWASNCSELNHTMKHPYIRALFHFLVSDDHSAILDDENIELSDRIAFACLHLNDKLLQEVMVKFLERSTQRGDLQGLMLTGLGDRGLQLLMNYVDKTCDVQSAVLLLLQAMPELNQLRGSLQLDMWIEDYRSLLDKMGLWTQRAEFDVFRMRLKKTNEKIRQIHISCTFCSKPIVTDNKTNRSRTTSAGAMTKPRIQSCPHCRKPLPRCSVCLLFLGTASGIGCPKNYKSSIKHEKKLSGIGDWFTWCQTCLHGGHAGHMMDWFKIRSTCPISGCNCKCDHQDNFGRKEVLAVDSEEDVDDYDRHNVESKNLHDTYHNGEMSNDSAPRSSWNQ